MKISFINPKTDFAFKKIFGSEQSKEILISFLNAMLYEGEDTISLGVELRITSQPSRMAAPRCANGTVHATFTAHGYWVSGPNHG